MKVIVNQEHIHLLWSSRRAEKQIIEYLWANITCEKSEVNHMFSKIYSAIEHLPEMGMHYAYPLSNKKQHSE